MQSLSNCIKEYNLCPISYTLLISIPTNILPFHNFVIIVNNQPLEGCAICPVIGIPPVVGGGLAGSDAGVAHFKMLLWLWLDVTLLTIAGPFALLSAGLGGVVSGFGGSGTAGGGCCGKTG